MGFLSGGPGAGLGLSPETAGLVASQTAGKFRGINMFSILAQRQLGVGGSPMAFAERAQLAMLPDENLKRMGRLEEIQKFRKDGLGGTDELTSTTKLSMAGIRGFLSLFPGIDKKPGQLQMAQTVMAGQGLNLDVDTLSRISRGVETKDDTEKITDLTRDNKEIFNKVEKNTENSANYLGTLVDLYAASLTGEEGKKFIEEWLRNWKLGLGEGSPIGTGAGGVGGGARGGSWTGWEERETALLPKFNAAGQKWGVDPALLASVSKFESIGYNLDIKNPYSSATGLSQGLDKEWGEYIKETGNRGASKTNADDSIDFMGWLAAKKQRAVGSNPEAVAKAYTGFGHSSGLGGTAGEIGNIVNDIPRIRKKMNATSPETEALVGFIHTAEVLKQIADNTKQANSINMSYMDQERNKISNDPAQYDTRSGN